MVRNIANDKNTGALASQGKTNPLKAVVTQNIPTKVQRNEENSKLISTRDNTNGRK